MESAGKCDFEAELAAHCLLAMSNSKFYGKETLKNLYGATGSTDRQSPLSSEGSSMTAKTGSSAGAGVMEEPVDLRNAHHAARLSGHQLNDHPGHSSLLKQDKRNSNMGSGSPAEQQQLGAESLFMIARILTDLNCYKQDPVPLVIDEPRSTSSSIGGSSMKCSLADQRDASRPKEGRSKTRKARSTKLSNCNSTKPLPLTLPLATIAVANSPSAVGQAVDETSAKKCHRCSFANCDKVYGKSSHLKAHLRTHTGNQLIPTNGLVPPLSYAMLNMLGFAQSNIAMRCCAERELMWLD